jgi:hypothetical protein
VSGGRSSRLISATASRAMTVERPTALRNEGSLTVKPHHCSVKPSGRGLRRQTEAIE